MSSVGKSTKVYSGFAPTQIPGCALWLDAADPSSLTLSGSNVTTWRDKSGNGGNATQNTSGNRPTFTGSGVVFNAASSQWLQLNTTYASTHSIFIVATPTSATNVYLFGRAYASGAPTMIINYVGTSLEYYQGGDGSTRSTYGSPTSTFIAGYVRTYGSSVVGRLNGAQVISTGGPTSEPSSIAWGDLGRSGIDANYYTGTIYEFMIFNAALTTAQCQQVEGYLAQKWGLASVMPASHPFGLSIAPSPQSFSPRDIDGCKVWLDAADTTTITASGSTVSAWRDKASGLTFSNSGTVTYTESSKTMNFTGTNTLTNATGVSTYVGVNQFVVWSSPVGATRQRIFQQTYTGQYAFGIIDTNFIQNLYSASVGYYVGPLTYSASTPYLYSVNTRSGTGLTYSVNGIESSAWTSAYTPGLQSTSLFVGGSSLFPFTGSVMEIIHYDAFLTVAQTQQIEGYLAWKWGLIPNIPAPHPYKLALPYVRQFSPRDIAGCILWLDAADTSVFNGGSTWTDKSGTGNHAVNGTPGTTAMPTVTTWSTGTNAARFDAASKSSMKTTNNIPNLNVTYFIVARVNDTTVERRIMINDVDGQRQFNATANFPSTVFAYGSGSAAQVNILSVAQSQAFQICLTVASGSTGFNGYGNGTLAGTTATFTSSPSKHYFSGDSGAAGGFLSGDIAEILIYNTVLSTAQRQQVEGYLAWKWNLTTNLPAAHPFEDKPPYAQPFLPTNVAGCSMWLDAADTGSVTLSGSNVTQWSDKSGNGRNAVVSSTAFATYSNSGLYFANSLYTTTLSASPTNETLFLVFNNTSTSNTGAIIGAYGGGREIANYDSNRTVGIVKAQIVWGPYANFPAFNAKYMAACIVSPTATKVIVNGGTSITTGSAITFSSSSNTILGREAGVDFGVTGIMHEVISFNSVLSDTQRQQVEGYLAWKWGLTSFLSVGHPFKYSAPSYYIPPFAPTDLAGCSLWLDAADSTSLTLSGSNVTTWADKSGNGRNATGYNNTATYNASGLNTGYPGLEFSSTKSMRSSVASGVFSTAVSGFVVYKFTGSVNLSAAYGLVSRTVSSANGVPTPFDMYSFNGASYRVIGNGTSYTLSTASPNYITNTTPTLYAFGIQSSATTTWNERINGTSAVITTSGGTGAAYGDTGSFVVIGGRLDTAVYFQGVISEVIFYNTALTTTQRQMVENYLAWKWGLNQSLVARPNVRPLPLYTRPINPLDIEGCALWLDAADATSLTLSGSNVTAWADKSGNGKNATALTAASYSNNGLVFTGTQSYDIPLNFPSSQSGFIVVSHASTNNMDVLGIRYSSGSIPGYQIIISGNTQWINVWGGARVITGGTVNQNTPFIYGYTFQSAGAAGTNFTYANGVQTGTNGSTAPTLSGSATLMIGSYVIGAQQAEYFIGTINEIVLYNTNLTTTQRQQIEGYLAHKWKLTSSVATTHPFKRFPSLTTTFAPAQLSGLALWLDAADPNTVVATGSNVTQWRDKSGNGRNATPYDTGYPAYSSNGWSGGLPTITFGTAASFICSIPSGTFSSGVTMFVVWYRTDALTAAEAVLWRATSAPYPGPWGMLTETYPARYIGNGPSQGFSALRSSTIPSSLNAPRVTSIVLDGTMTWLEWANGTSYTFTSFYTQNAQAYVDTENSVVIGVRPDKNTGAQLKGNISEIILFRGVLTSAQRQQVEGYLAWKWGLVGSLPSTHPYKKFTP
jgi:hypothetical protein